MPIPLSKHFGRGEDPGHGIEFNGGIYEIENAGFANSRIEDGDMKGTLEVGDLILCIDHTEHCFHRFIIIKATDKSWRGVPDKEFGAFSGIGKEVHRVDDATFDSLTSGKWVRFKTASKVDNTPAFLKATI